MRHPAAAGRKAKISEPTWNPPHLSGLDSLCLDANAESSKGFRGYIKKFGRELSRT
jgi:hypothetical protein